MIVKDIFFKLCSNWKQIKEELALSDERIERSRFGWEFQKRILHITYPVGPRDNDRDKFTLVRGLEGPNLYTAIDDGLLDIIRHLNGIGIKTCYCCEGHLSGNPGLAGRGNLMFETPDRTNKSLNVAILSLSRKGIVSYSADCPGQRRTNLEWVFRTEEEKKQILTVLNETLLAVRDSNPSFLVFPIKDARKLHEDLNGDFIQEELSDSQARIIAESVKDDPLAGEYTLDELLAEFNGDIHSRFNSEKYYIYRLKSTFNI